jgi:hypothetical protein
MSYQNPKSKVEERGMVRVLRWLDEDEDEDDDEDD